jgi:hypothetical protein
MVAQSFPMSTIGSVAICIIVGRLSVRIVSDVDRVPTACGFSHSGTVFLVASKCRAGVYPRTCSGLCIFPPSGMAVTYFPAGPLAQAAWYLARRVDGIDPG